MPLISLLVFYCSTMCSVNHVSIYIQAKALGDSAVQWAMLLPLGKKVSSSDSPSGRAEAEGLEGYVDFWTKH